MRRRGVLIGVLASLAIVAPLSLAGCGSTQTFRYKMTVEVETPEGVKTGYAVREMRYRGSRGFAFGEGKPQLRVAGEAVAVDLPGGQTLFALLQGEDGSIDYAGHSISAIFRVMDRDRGPVGGPHELWPKVPVIREPITDPLPMLVAFSDPDDPRSVQQLKPNALDRLFGPEVRLKRIVIEQSQEPLTIGVLKRLRWSDSYRNLHLDGSPASSEDLTSTSLSSHLSINSFSTIFK